MSSTYLKKNENGRIEWIDAIKGFTIILVVFSHVELYGLHGVNSSIDTFFMIFRMPLFFFMSGFISYHHGKQWTREQFKVDIRKKSRIQLIPMFFFSILYCILIKAPARGTFDGVFIELLLSNYKFGYWFTLVLYEMFLIFFVVSRLSFRRSELKNKSDGMYALVGISVLFVLIYLFANKYSKIDSDVIRIFNLMHLFKYFQFFVFGLLQKIF